jgi:hypothetical protein
MGRRLRQWITIVEVGIEVDCRQYSARSNRSRGCSRRDVLKFKDDFKPHGTPDERQEILVPAEHLLLAAWRL